MYTWVEGKAFGAVQLSFRKSLYCTEVATTRPFIGLTTYGPYEATDVRILHIVPDEISCYLKQGKILDMVCEQLCERLRSFLEIVGKKVEVESERVKNVATVNGRNVEISPEIKDRLSKAEKFVILLPLIRKCLGDRITRSIYAKLKALGLEKGCTIQVYADKTIEALLLKESERADALLWNLALNVFAKAGGKPWALYNELSYDLILGIGWSIKKRYETVTGPVIKYYGLIHTFSNIGVWDSFEALILEGEVKRKAQLIVLEEALSFVIENKIKDRKHNRILVLTRETLETDVIRKLGKHCKKQGLDLDIARISDTHPIRMYSTSSNTLTIPKGVCFALSDRVGLVATTGEVEGKYYGIGVPKPLLVTILMTTREDKQLETLYEVMRATYELTAMNWRTLWTSIRLPTPVHYSKIVAQMFEMLSDTDIERAFLKKGKHIYMPAMLGDRPWFI